MSPEQYAAPTSYVHGGLRATMVHILDNIWQQRITLQGYYQEPLADEAAYDATELHEDAFPTFAPLQERWMIEQREIRAYYALDGIERRWLVPSGMPIPSSGPTPESED